MITTITIVIGCVLVLTLPHWLPSLVIRLRTFLFTQINGEEAVALPGQGFDVGDFRALYGQKAARGRSRGAALSDLFWYWLSPGPEMHQEHIEDGPDYEQISRLTHKILAVSRDHVDQLADQYTRRHIDTWRVRGRKVIRLRDAMMPLWADFYYRIVFGEECPAHARELIVGNARNVANALKCCDLRRMKRRLRLTRYLVARVEEGALPHPFPDGFSVQQQAYYLQGTFFNTAIVQSSEGMAHLLLAIAQNRRVHDRLARSPDDDIYWDQTLKEALRRYPLFGISHRITTQDIAWAPGRTMPSGSVLCFNHLAYHLHGYLAPEEFRPERWDHIDEKQASFIPFGMPGNRPCPAQRLAFIAMKRVAQVVLRHFDLYSSVEHSRSLPSRGPCILVSKGEQHSTTVAHLALMAGLRVRDRWENVYRSIVQLVLGTYMVWDARRLKLCQRYFEQHEPRALSDTPSKCPRHAMPGPKDIR